MSLQQQYMVSNNVPGADLSITPLTGTSLKIIGIYVSNDASGYATVEIGKTTVGYFRVDSTMGNHLSFPVFVTATGTVPFLSSHNLFNWLMSNTDFDGYPVGQGETFRVTGSWGAKTIITVVYQIYDATDMTSSMNNGSQANIYHVANYGEISGGITGAGLFTVNITQTPVQFPSFPFGESCPSNTKVSLLAIASRNMQYITGTANTYTTTEYLKLTRDRTVLFDEDKNGIRFYGGDDTTATASIYAAGASLIGDNSSLDIRSPFVPPAPIIFNAGDELLCQIQAGIGTSGVAIPATSLDLCFLEKIQVTGGV